MSEKHLDDAIDRAVREMMNVDAGPAFRARVLARLNRPAPRRLTWPRLAAAGVAAAALVVAFLLTRPLDTGEPAPVAGNNPSATAPPIARKSAAPAQPTPEPVRQPTQPTIARIERAPTNITQYVPQGALTATVADQEPDMSVAALDRIEPIAVAPLDRSPIAPAAIVVTPLTPITEVQIAPLFPQIVRD